MTKIGNTNYKLIFFFLQDIDELIYRLEELKQQNHYGNYFKRIFNLFF